MQSKKAFQDILLLMLLAIIWGSAFMAAKIGLESFQPLSLAAFRLSLGAIALLIVTYATGARLPSTTTKEGRISWFFAFWVALITNAMPFTILNWAQQFVPSSFAGMMMAAVPIFVLILAHFFTDESITKSRLLAVMIGLFGVWLLIGQGEESEAGHLLARLACVLAALGYASGTVIQKKAPIKSAIGFSAAILLLASLIQVPLALAVEGWPSFTLSKGLWAAIYLGLCPTALAAYVMLIVIRSAGSNFFGLVNFFVPVWAVLFGTVFLQEALPPSFALALALILGALFLIRRSPQKVQNEPISR